MTTLKMPPGQLGTMHKLVSENLSDFTRGREPKKAMGIGQVVDNRDPETLMKNFKEAHPEINHAHRGESFMANPKEGDGHWQTLSSSMNNPEHDIEHYKEKYLKWFDEMTDWDIVEIDSAFIREWHPWGDESKPLQRSGQVSFKFRNNEDVAKYKMHG